LTSQTQNVVNAAVSRPFRKTGAPEAEIEITPEMIEAGRVALANGADPDVPVYSISSLDLAAAYSAMVRASKAARGGRAHPRR
jgi:hypothetical protein